MKRYLIDKFIFRFSALNMRHMILTVALGSAILSSAFVNTQAVNDVTAVDILKHLQETYHSAKDATIEFTQTVKFTLTNAVQTFRGTLFMKKPNYYRFENEEQTIVTNGKIVWSYSAVNHQVVVDTYRDDPQAFTPDRFLFGLPRDYYSALLGKEKLRGKEMYVLRLVPKEEQAFVRSLKLWVDPEQWVARKVIVVDVNETETTYILARISFNTGLSNSLFEFSPPKGTEVVDLRKQK
ncbi:MAG: outer membrane lipoprotein chaperone LolA [Bacteroidota bacterium]